MTVHIEVRAPEFVDSDDDCEDTVSDCSSEGEESSEYAIVLEYKVEEYRKMFQSMSLEKSKLENVVQATASENHSLVDKNQQLKQKLQVAEKSERIAAPGDEHVSKKYRAARPQRNITTGVLDLDDSAIYRDIDFVEEDGPVYRSASGGDGFVDLDDDEPVYRDAGVLCPVMPVEIETIANQFVASSSKQDAARPVSAPKPATIQPELHVYRKKESASDAAHIESEVKRLTEMHESLKKSLDTTVQAVSGNATVKKEDGVELADDTESDSGDDDDDGETDERVKQILSSLTGHVQKQESVTTFLAKKVAKQEVEIRNLQNVVRRLAAYIVAKDPAAKI